MALDRRCGVNLARISKRKAPMERSFHNLNVGILFLKIRLDLKLWRSFEVEQLKEKHPLQRSIGGRDPAPQKDLLFSVVMVTRIALDCRLKLRGRSQSTRERTSFVAVPQTENGHVFVLESRELAFLSCLGMYISRLKSSPPPPPPLHAFHD